MLKITEGLHLSKVSVGYFYFIRDKKFVAFVGLIEIQEYNTIKECLESFKNRQ